MDEAVNIVTYQGEVVVSNPWSIVVVGKVVLYLSYYYDCPLSYHGKLPDTVVHPSSPCFCVLVDLFFGESTGKYKTITTSL